MRSVLPKVKLKTKTILQNKKTVELYLFICVSFLPNFKNKKISFSLLFVASGSWKFMEK